MHGLRWGEIKEKKKTSGQFCREGKYLVGGEEEEGKKKRRLINWKTKRLEGMYCGRMEERVSIKSEDSVVALPLSSNIVQQYIKIESRGKS